MKLFSTIVLIVLAVVVALFFAWTQAPDFLAHALSKKMKVEVKIEDINLSSGNINIEKIEIGNPKGSYLAKAFSTEETNITAPFSNYIKDQIVIDQITLDHVYIGLEFKSKGSKDGNWTTIMNNLKETSGEKKSGHSVLIKKLILTNIQADLVYHAAGNKVQHLSPISRLEFTNVTSEEGIPADQIAHVIFEQTLRSLFSKENIENMLENALKNPGSAVDQLTQPFKSLLP